MTTFLYFTLQN